MNMRILHYTLGFQPYRTGGLVKYATDLMIEQCKLGHQVFALYPAQQIFFSRKVRIKKGKDESSILKYELVNSLPLAIFGGIQEPMDFMYSCDTSVYLEFLREISPDIIHIHSLMGIHKEFFEVAKKLNIRIVFTSHDYFGLAPLPTFYAQGKSYDNDNSNLSWNIMSANALSSFKLRVFQNRYYPLIRSFFKKINKKNKLKKDNDSAIYIFQEKVDFTSLKRYYQSIFKMIDLFIFNSSIARDVYLNNIDFKIVFDVISITNASLGASKLRADKSIKEKISIGYIGPDEEYKGYYEFIKLCNSLDKNKFNFYTYGHDINNIAPSFIRQRGRFKSSQLDSIYQELDFIVVPSLWKETFGFIALEAISYGVRVLVSENVGAKDLLDRRSIFSDIYNLRFDFSEKNRFNIKTIDQHCEEIINVYRKLL